MRSIIISSITGLTPPYEIYICDVYGERCQYINTITNNVPPNTLSYGNPSKDIKNLDNE